MQIVPFADAERTYEELASGERRSLSIVLRYAEDAEPTRTVALRESTPRAGKQEIGIAFVGAGNYAKGVLLPALQGSKDVRFQALVGLNIRERVSVRYADACAVDPDVEDMMTGLRGDGEGDIAAVRNGDHGTGQAVR